MNQMQGILPDKEIYKAIERGTRVSWEDTLMTGHTEEKGYILVEHPELFLGDQSRDYIQPASLDVTLRECEGFFHSIPLTGRESVREHPLPDLGDNFVTFWPQKETDIIINELRWFDGEILGANVELRSTLRRLGLEVGNIGVGPFFTADGGYIHIRNPQAYPISVEIGTKVAQLLFRDRELIEKKPPEEYGYKPHGLRLEKGNHITTNRLLEALIKVGEIKISPEYQCKDGMILFRAGKVATRYETDHIILHADKKTEGVKTLMSEESTHLIKPGEFADIETIESLELSERVGIHVTYWLYGHGWDEASKTQSDIAERWNTLDSTGGWIDPGYKGGFSVQRKAFTRDLVIKEGDVMVLGMVYYFPDGVGTPYGKERGSHFQGEDSFRATQG